MFKSICLLVLALNSAPALAAYKCESGGKISYGDEPCRSGTTVALPEPPGGDDAAQAKMRAAREKREAERLENARHKREAAEEKLRTRIAKADAARRKKCQSLAMSRKWSEEDAAAATGKSAEKAKRKARRKAEQYEAECGK